MHDGISGLLAGLALLGSIGADGPAALVIEVDAGALDRRDTPIRLHLPADLKEKIRYGELRPVDGPGPLPGQLNSGELAWSIAPALPAGSRRRYRLAKLPMPDIRRSHPTTLVGDAWHLNYPRGRGLEFAWNSGVLNLLLDGRRVLSYRDAVAEPPPGIDPMYRRSGFLHPLATRSGVVVTDDFPPDHAHQHGFFTAWVDTTFDGRKVDFWNQQTRTGRVGKNPAIQGPTFFPGPIEADFFASLRHDDLTAPGGPEPVLDETWEVRAYDIPGLVVADFESKQTCAGAKLLKLDKHIYGGMGFRGNRQWLDPTAKGDDPPDPSRSGRVEFLTGEGKRRLDGNHTRPRWVDLSGEVDGKVAGVAVLDHPSNFRFPQPVRLHPNKPYFSFAPPVVGEFEIAPGTTYTSRYRLVVHDGRPDPAVIERLYADFADPPTARIVAVEE